MRYALLVVLGSALWATDAIFRHPLVQQISPFTIVFFEHIFATAISFIVLMMSKERRSFFIGSKEFFVSAFVGIFGSAVATVLFTMSFQLINPSVAILLQKIQPIFVILFSYLFLGETLSLIFFFWATIALVSAFFLSFPLRINFSDFKSSTAMGCSFSILAAFLWAASTTAGKFALQKTPAIVLSFWRFAFGLMALYALSRRFDVMQVEIPFVPGQPGVLRSLFIMALIPGFLGVSLYYAGLKKISASTATILELSFPVSAVAMNFYFLNIHLTAIQYSAASALILAMVGVSQTIKR